MRFVFTILILSVASHSLPGQNVAPKNDPKKHPALTNKTFVSKLDGRPIDFYLHHKDIDAPAKLFYKGQYALYDDDETFGFLDSLLTNNPETKPFYEFVFNQAMKVSDGAISEYMAEISKRHLEQSPCDFLRNITRNVSKVDRDAWTDFIGWQIYDRKSFDILIPRLDKAVLKTCPTQKETWDKLKVEFEAKLEQK
jgi:hypothetical protein